MRYRLVYDAATAGPDLFHLAVPAALVILFIVRAREERPKGGAALSAKLAAVAMVLLALAVMQASWDHRRALADLHNPRTYVSEGRVEHFSPEPWEGHSEESFYVDGARFSYSEAIATGAFHDSAAFGGPIREGLPVRITHLANRILRLEVAEPGGPQRAAEAARR